MKFSEFIQSNEGLSSKVLSQRLRELQNVGIIYKRILSKNPVKVEYELTEKGRQILQNMNGYWLDIRSGQDSFKGE